MTTADPKIHIRKRRCVWFWSITAGILSLVIAWFVWAALARHRLNTAIRAVQARHEPILPADFAKPSMPDLENSAIYWMKAANAVKPLDNYDTDIPEPADSSENQKWLTAIQPYLNANRAAISAADEAATLAQARWDFDVQSSPQSQMQETMDAYQSLRSLGNLLDRNCLALHIGGEDQAALRSIFYLLRESRAVSESNMFFGQFGAISLKAQASNRLIKISPSLNNSIRSNADPAASRLMRDILTDLTDEEREHQRVRRLFLLERSGALSAWEGIGEFLLYPAMTLDIARQIQDLQPAVLAADATDWPSAHQIIASAGVPIRGRYSTSFGLETSFLNIFQTGYNPDTTLLLQWRVAAVRRVAAVSLAANLFHLDHSRWPAKLSELVPDYLPSVPLDPFRSGKLAIGYVIQNPAAGIERPLLFFDQSGSPGMNPPATRPVIEWNYMANARQWIDLSVDWAESAATRPSTSPATQGSE